MRPALAPANMSSVDYWRHRIRLFLAVDNVTDAARLADRVLDEIYPGRWKG